MPVVVDPVPPLSRTPPPVADPGLPTFSRRAAAAAVLASLPLFATLLVALLASAGQAVHDADVVALVAVCSIGSGVGLFVALSEKRRLARLAADERPRGRWLAVAAAPLAVAATLWGVLLVLASTMRFTRGRQLRVRGRPLLAKLVAGDTWLDDGPRVTAPPAAAEAWRENGKTEHASVAAFARLASELVAMGAPAALVEAAHRDALDESAHTRLCFTLAKAIDGRALEPGPLPVPASLPSMSRTARLARLAVESLVDGALHEGASARVAARLARRAGDERIRHVLAAIAADEGRHARHGFDVLAWCLAAGGPLVRASVDGALRALPATLGRSLFPAADDGALEAYGIPGRALLDESYRDVRAVVVERTRALLGPLRAVA